jgi:hypothetical protein
MEYKDLAGGEVMPTVEKSKESSYKVISFNAIIMPKQYINMIYSKWLRSLRFGNDYFKLIEPKAYFEAYNAYIKTILERPTTTVRIAALTDDLDVALGFSVAENNTLHYVHVHRDNRKQGIGRSLVPFKVETITHITKTGLVIWAEKLPTAIFNPF